MDNEAKWQKFGNPADLNGFNLPGLELFNRGGQVPSVVRETGQNSIDNPDKSENPVILSYKKHEIPIDDIPDREELIKILKACIQFGYDSGQKDTDEPMMFMLNALNQLQNDLFIPFLEISDHNTTGIEGEDGNYRLPWERMTGAIGISDGSESTRGGSRGIGKFAPLLLSSLRTLFISTKTEEGVAFKGGAQFTSFEEDGEYYEAKVKFEKDGRRAIRNEEEIPEFFRRSEIGTSVFVAGFMHSDDWEEQIIQAVLTNFYAAIHSGKLVVKTDHHLINSSNLESYIVDHADQQTKMFYETLKDGVEFSETVVGFGELKLYVKLDDLYTKRIDYMRDKRMKIFDQKRGPLLTKNYAAVFICDGKEGSTKLRLMEGAEHVSWKPRNSSEREEFSKLKNWIEDKIKSFEPEEEEEETTVSGLEKFLPYVDNGDGEGASIPGEGAQRNETAKEKIIEIEEEIVVDPSLQSTTMVITPDGKIQAPVKVGKGKKGDSEPDPEHTKSQTKTKENKKRKPKSKKNFNFNRLDKFIIKNDSAPYQYDLFIKSEEDKAIQVDIYLYVVSYNGERIPDFLVLRSATYANGEKIAKVGAKDILRKVQILPGMNKIILYTKTDSKYAFNIEGYESK
ncbi:hypothetical protein [Salinimicrobium sediminilitoris]|uniref:hypothetical protein n=1 Tax=Salinimicrobium sediminilitoris TaxID=2876715 RepID=UPI001E4E36A1|nr:hypothetical protein [Salinimicrobium sediminilitoris]MCC8361018.1 hypothetical protein [Salinimicrobium sediminilitoris]